MVTPSKLKMNKEELKLSPIRKKSSSSLLDDICGENTLCNNGTTIEIDEENKENDILAKSANSDSAEPPKKAEKEDSETQVDEEKSKKPKTLSRTSLLANFIAGCVNEQLKKNRKLKKNQPEPATTNGAENESETDDEEDETEEEEEEDEENSDDSNESEDDDDDYEDEEEEDEADGEEEDEDDEEFDIETNNGVGLENRAGFDSGCTAVVALLKENKYLYVANAGDSRCVVCRDGKAVEMSEDHKPEDDLERNRIEKAGGQVTKDGRVNNGLNLSRAIGDHAYKTNKELGLEEQMITSLPDVRTLEIDPEKDSFMVLACDGIWNFMSSQEVCDYVQERLNANYSKLSQICEELFMHCLAPDSEGDGTGCDNMTCIIVTFKPFRKTSGKLNESLEKVNLKRSLVEVKDAASDNSSGGNEITSKKLKHDEVEMKLD